MKAFQAKYSVSISEDNRRLARVCCKFTLRGGFLSMNNNGAGHIPDGYAHFVKNLSVKDALGNSADIGPLDNARWKVRIATPQPVVLSYDVVLDHENFEWPAGPDEAPYAKEDCVFWTGRALFIVSDFQGATVHFDVPSDWRVSTPWRAVEGQSHTFYAEDDSDLTDAFILAGNHFEGSIGTKGLEIKLALGGDLQKWKEEIRKAVEKLFDVCFRLFGGAPDRTLLLVANLYNRPHSCDGGVFGRSVSILMGNPPTSEYNQMWIPFVCHEMFHFWNGYAIKPQGQEYWFLEGFTEYYASVLPVRLALIGPESYLRSLASACQRYLERAGQISIRQAGDSKFDHPQLVYQGGCLIAAILDIQIRRLTKNDKGLDDVMRQIYQEYGEGSKRYTLEDVVKTCNEVSGSDLRGFFSSHVQGTGILPLERYLGEAGLNITRSGPSLKFVVFKLLKINSLTSTPEGLVVHRSQGAGYQDGDILVTIAGRSVQGNDDLCHVSRDLSPGDTVEIELLRSGQKTRQKVVLGGHDATDHQRFEPRVEITSKPQVSDLEQAILSGILTGKN